MSLHSKNHLTINQMANATAIQNANSDKAISLRIM
jgi:hypothetical protein